MKKGFIWALVLGIVMILGGCGKSNNRNVPVPLNTKVRNDTFLNIWLGRWQERNYLII